MGDSLWYVTSHLWMPASGWG